MPTTNTNFTTLITAIDTKAQQLASSTTDPKDLVFLGKAVEALNVADTVSSVIDEGDTQVAAVAAQGVTSIAAVVAQGNSYLEKANNLSGLASPSIARSNLGFASEFTNLLDGQGLVYDGSLSKWVNGDTILKAATNPPYNTGTYTLGTVWANTTTGVLFVCRAVNTSVTPTEYIWEGTDGNVVGIAQGEQLFVNENYLGYNDDSYTSFTTTFVVPDTVTSLCAVCVGGGGGGGYAWANGGGGGGALAWANDIAVTAGETLTLQIGHGGTEGTNVLSTGGDTLLKRGDTIIFGAQGGRAQANVLSEIAAPIAGTVTPGNNDSGRGGLSSTNYGAGGGAGGYTGNGGNGGYGTTFNPSNTFNSGNGGTGGAAGGGIGYHSSTYGFAGGGGVGLYGEGPSGPALSVINNNHSSDMRHSGRPGSGGEAGSRNHNNSGVIHSPSTSHSDGYGYFGEWDNGTKSFPDMSTDGTVRSLGSKRTVAQQGGHFGGGGGGGGTSNTNHSGGYQGGMGGARLVWGANRSFPSTRVNQLPDIDPSGN